MSFKRGSGVVIRPYYDGMLLPGIHEVAGDGLSVLSIKERHGNCRFTLDPGSGQHVISCARGMKARNSFWNLHKPDLRKVKGLECATTESVTHMFHKHNPDRAEKPSYKRRMLRLLGSLVPSKAKPQQRPLRLEHSEALTRTTAAWPRNRCVLAGICQEEEVKPRETFKPETEASCSFCILGNKSTSIEEEVEGIKLLATDKILINNSCAVTVGSSKVDSTNIGICTDVSLISSALELELGNMKPTSRDYLLDETQNLSVSKNVKSPLVLVPSIEVKSLKESAEIEEKKRTPALTEDRSQPNLTAPEELRPDLEVPEASSSEVVEAVFVEMFKEMVDIEDYIRSYISSFCALEEEFDNQPVLKRTPSEFVSHILEQLHSPTKISVGNDKKNEIDIKDNSDPNNEHWTIEKGEHAKLHENLEQVPLKDDVCSCVFAKDETINEMEQSKASDFSNNKIGDSSLLFPHNFETNNDLLLGEQSGYCYWEDCDTYDFKDKSEVHSGILLPVNNDSLINVQFFESIWKEIFDNIGKDFVLRNEDGVPNDISFLQQNEWKNKIDKSFIEEVENMIHTIDNFIMNECFPHEENHVTPCSILEISDDKFEGDFMRADSKRGPRMNPAENEEPLDKRQVKYKTTTKSCEFNYFQHLSESQSNLSLYPGEELGNIGMSPLTNSRKQIMFLQSNEKMNEEGISQDSQTGLEDTVVMGFDRLYFNNNKNLTTSFSEMTDLRDEQKVSKDMSMMCSMEPISKIEELNIELMPAYSEMVLDVVSVSNTRIKHNGKIKTNVEICDSLLKGAKKVSTKGPEIMIELEHVVDEVGEFAESINHLQEENVNEKNIYTEISKSGSVSDSEEKTLRDSGLIRDIDSLNFLGEDRTLENDTSTLKIQENCSNVGRSMLVQIPENNSPNNSQFLFSTTKVQLNLTNPVSNTNKK